MKTIHLGEFLRAAQDRTNLRHQLGLAMSVLCFFIVATLAGSASIVGEREARSATSEGLVGLASTLSDRLERGISQRASVVEVLARIDSLKPLWSADPSAVQKLLQQSLVLFSNGSSFRFANPDGVVAAAAGSARTGETVANERWFKRGLHATVVEPVDDQAYSVSGLGPNGAPFPIVDIAAPVRDTGGKVTGVLSLSLNWVWAAALRQETLSRSSQSKSKELWILSNDGEVMIGPKVGTIPYSEKLLSEMRTATRGAFSDTSNKEPILTGFAVSSSNTGTGWIIVAREPEAIAFVPAERVVSIIVALGLLTATVGIFASLWVADRIARPIKRLADEADLIERDSVQMLPRARGSREVMHLSSALRALLLRLSSAERHRAAVENQAADVESRLNRDIARLKNLAETDSLTKLLNRRRFLDLAAEAMMRFGQDGVPFGILMIDIDRFKSVNDRFGHATGDRAITWVATKIAASVRPRDTTARFGGEEFIVLVPNVSSEAVWALGNRIRTAIANEPLYAEPHPLSLTVSIGIAIAQPSDQSLEEIVGRADLALYSAKAQGRNAVVREISDLRGQVQWVA